jgi:hypothetical protein
MGEQQLLAHKHFFAVLVKLEAKSTTPSCQEMLAANVQPVSVQTYSAEFVERSQEFGDSHPDRAKRSSSGFSVLRVGEPTLSAVISTLGICITVVAGITWSASDTSTMCSNVID